VTRDHRRRPGLNQVLRKKIRLANYLKGKRNKAAKKKEVTVKSAIRVQLRRNRYGAWIEKRLDGPSDGLVLGTGQKNAHAVVADAVDAVVLVTEILAHQQITPAQRHRDLDLIVAIKKREMKRREIGRDQENDVEVDHVNVPEAGIDRFPIVDIDDIEEMTDIAKIYADTAIAINRFTNRPEHIFECIYTFF
jgi:hypothetical protein